MVVNWRCALLAGLISVSAISGCARNVYSSRNLATVNRDLNGLTYALPTTWFEIASTPADGGLTVIDVGAVRLPDAGHVYSLDHTASQFAHDEILIEVGENQLLQQVNTTTEDVTDQIIVSVAKTAASLATFSVPPIAPQDQKRGDDLFACAAPPPSQWRVILDPFNTETWPSWLSHQCLKMALIAAPEQISDHNNRSDEDCRRGICHRAPVPYRVEIDLGPAGVHQFVAPVLNGAPILSIDVNRTAFVENKTNLTFTDGVLTSMSATRPSPVLEVVQLPVEVAKAVLSAPAEILRLRVDYSTQAVADLEAEQKLLEASEAFDAFRKELIENQETEQP